VRAKQLDIAGVEEQMAKLDSMLKEARGQTEKVQKEYNTMSEKVGFCIGCLGVDTMQLAGHLLVQPALFLVSATPVN
jgi:hypothetical protein